MSTGAINPIFSREFFRLSFVLPKPESSVNTSGRLFWEENACESEFELISEWSVCT